MRTTTTPNPIPGPCPVQDSAEVGNSAAAPHEVTEGRGGVREVERNSHAPFSPTPVVHASPLCRPHSFPNFRAPHRGNHAPDFFHPAPAASTKIPTPATKSCYRPLPLYPAIRKWSPCSPSFWGRHSGMTTGTEPQQKGGALSSSRELHGEAGSKPPERDSCLCSSGLPGGTDRAAASTLYFLLSLSFPSVQNRIANGWLTLSLIQGRGGLGTVAHDPGCRWGAVRRGR